MEWPFIVKSFVLALSLGGALYQDLKEKKIKNLLTLPAALAGAAINLGEKGFPGILHSLAGWLVPLAVLIVLYYINVMGAGDIKLFAAIGAVMGLDFVCFSFAFSIYVGAVIALVLLIKRGCLLAKLGALCNYFEFILVTGRIVPYCPEGTSDSKFAFSTAIVPGTLIQYLRVVMQ